MTMIHDMAPPAVDGELRQPEVQPPVKRSTKQIVALLCGSAMVVAVMNAIAAIHLYRASQEIRTIEARLEELADFEKRMKDRLDLVNTGLQSQFDQLNQDLQSGFGELHAGMKRLGQNFEATGTRARDSLGFENASLDSEPMVAEVEPDGGDSTASGTPGTVSRSRPADSMPAISPAYRRNVMPDGKVYYRKVH